MSNGRVFLTGAFGNVGRHTIKELTEQAYDIVAFDLETDTNKKVAQQLNQTYRFDTQWGNLQDAKSVENAVLRSQPDVILHVAAIIAPLTFVMPDLAHDVNVNGARYLIQAAQKLSHPPKFINVSSYSVVGSQNPHKDKPPITGETPANPFDNYGRHKAEVEALVAASELGWTTIRLPAVMTTTEGWGQGEAFTKYMFLLSPEEKMHTIDVRDAALALVNAIAADTDGQVYAVGGPEHDCRMTYGEHMAAVLDARGLKPLPHTAFRQPDPAVDEAWNYQGFVDTTRSQQILTYQRYTFADHLEQVRQLAGATRHLLRVINPIVQRSMLKHSNTYRQDPRLDSRPLWDVIQETFGRADQPVRQYRSGA